MSDYSITLIPDEFLEPGLRDTLSEMGGKQTASADYEFGEMSQEKAYELAEKLKCLSSSIAFAVVLYDDGEPIKDWTVAPMTADDYDKHPNDEDLMGVQR